MHAFCFTKQEAQLMEETTGIKTLPFLIEDETLFQ
jgi:hypothetical protein